MGSFKYLITVESDTPPQVMLGQSAFGGEIVGLEMEKIPTLVSVAWLVEKYGMAKTTIKDWMDLIRDLMESFCTTPKQQWQS